MNGYAVVDVETTGLHPRVQRIVEVAVVHVSPAGEITGMWDTLLNAQRDLGPQHIHGITAAEILRAPTFDQMAGELAELLRGRTLVAHNLRFDAGFLAAEYLRSGYEVPCAVEYGLCTMGLARRYLPGSGRSLVECCATFGITILDAHRASSDATAAAQLLAGYLGVERNAPHWTEAMARASALAWPPIPPTGATWFPRERGREPQQHFLSRLVQRLPDSGLPEERTAYLAMLDQALLDRHISVSEAADLVAVATELGIGRSAAHELHTAYLRQLAQVAWADGVISDDECHDLRMVGKLLGVRAEEVDLLVAETEPTAGSTRPSVQPAASSFALVPGDVVVFTGEMSRPRNEWEDVIAGHGLVPHSAVTKKVKLIVAADPDSLSGKARKARDYGIPVVTEDGLSRLLDMMQEHSR